MACRVEQGRPGLFCRGSGRVRNGPVGRRDGSGRVRRKERDGPERAGLSSGLGWTVLARTVGGAGSARPGSSRGRGRGGRTCHWGGRGVVRRPGAGRVGLGGRGGGKARGGQSSRSVRVGPVGVVVGVRAGQERPSMVGRARGGWARAGGCSRVAWAGQERLDLSRGAGGTGMACHEARGGQA